jgi:hypothetical protein
MSWNNFHNRGEILRAVVDTANDRRDGVLPTGVPGVTENFKDEIDLVGALLLKWHARLSGNIERALVREPLDLEAAVAGAWRTTAEQMPGVRLVIDRCADHPATPEMERAMNRAREHEWMRLATVAGLASAQDTAAIVAGRRVEDLARAGLELSVEAASTHHAAAPTDDQTDDDTGAQATPMVEPEPAGPSFVDRIRAALAA